MSPIVFCHRRVSHSCAGSIKMPRADLSLFNKGLCLHREIEATCFVPFLLLLFNPSSATALSSLAAVCVTIDFPHVFDLKALFLCLPCCMLCLQGDLVSMKRYLMSR